MTLSHVPPRSRHGLSVRMEEGRDAGEGHVLAKSDTQRLADEGGPRRNVCNDGMALDVENLMVTANRIELFEEFIEVETFRKTTIARDGPSLAECKSDAVGNDGDVARG